MPVDSCTKTTGETGRNVADPRSRISNGSCWRATFSRCSPTTSIPPGLSPVGGSSVTWVGIASANGSPNDERIDWSWEP